MSTTITKIPLLTELQGIWKNLRIQVHGSSESLILPNIYPFMSVNELKRTLWMSQNGSPIWAPERVFLGVLQEDGIRPLEFHWPSTVTNSSLPDPRTHKTYNPALVDAEGNRLAPQ